MATPERPLKRTRQACEPCRRKKSRCPGEKPTCSHCARLGQVCSYALDRDGFSNAENDRESSQPFSRPTSSAAADMTADRLSTLERNLAQIQSLLNTRSDGSSPSPVRAPEIQPRGPAVISSSSQSYGAAPATPSSAEVESAASLYARYCDCQPLPLFSMTQFQQSLASRDPELIYAIIALTFRFNDNSPTDAAAYQATCLENARQLVLQKAINGPVELSTIQTLCLLTMIDFNSGATARASSYSALAWNFVQSAGLAIETSSFHHPQVLEERRRCYWSTLLLKNLFSNIHGKITIMANEFSPRYPKSTEPPAGSSSNITEPSLPQSDGAFDISTSVDNGIMAYVIEMSEIWAKTIRYAHRRGKRQQPPSWSPESEYQQILAQLMAHETRVPYKYRYKPARFENYDGNAIQQNRTFWAPWYLHQMMYHSLLCLLNHPLVLSLHLRNLKMTMVPEVFLQHTDDLIQTHTTWVIHLIDDANAKGFVPSDPYPSYCVAVVATIFLQQSYADDEAVRSTKQENFNKCLAFVRASGAYWQRVAQLAQKVDMFQRIVAESSQNAASAADGKTYIDLSLFWEILEACFTSEQSAAAEGYFGRSLLYRQNNPGSSDVVNGRLLPAPTRLDRNASMTSTPLVSSAFNQSHVTASAGAFPSVDDQLQVLAQSYFAQGQDFVNLDDWWYPEPVLN